jgi:hypothetical protein
VLLLGALAGCAAGAIGLAQPADSFIARVRQLLVRASVHESTEHELALAIVFGDVHPVVAIDKWSDAQLRGRVRDNIEADYRRGRIVSRDAWQISATEADALELLRRIQLT